MGEGRGVGEERLCNHPVGSLGSGCGRCIAVLCRSGYECDASEKRCNAVEEQCDVGQWRQRTQAIMTL